MNNKYQQMAGEALSGAGLTPTLAGSSTALQRNAQAAPTQEGAKGIQRRFHQTLTNS